MLAETSNPDFTLLELQIQLETGEDADRAAGMETIGKALMQKQRYTEAVPVYESLLSLDPLNVEAQEKLARCLERLGRWGEAAARYRLVLDADPERTDALAELGLCLLRTDLPAPALGAFERCLRLNPSHVRALLGKATCLRLTGLEAEADAVYRQAIALQPEIESSLTSLIASQAPPAAPPPEAPPISQIAELENIIAAAVSAEDYITAAEHCQALTELAPDYYEAWFNLGVFEHRNSNLEASVEAFRQAGRLQPLAVEPWQALAQASHRQGDLHAAEGSYQAALAIAPDASDLLWNLGLVLEQQGNLEEAAEAYSRLVKTDQDRGEAWFRLGFARLHLEDHKAAALAFRRSMDLGTRVFESNHNLGLSYWKLGRVDEAVKCFRAAIRQQPDFQAAQLGLAAAALSQGDYSQARDLCRDLLEQGAAPVEVIFNLAVLEHRANRLHSAIDLYKQALKIDPDLAEASAGLGLAQGTLSARRYK